MTAILSRKGRWLLVASLWTWAFSAIAAEGDYPSRMVTVIVPFPAGGPTDQLARVIASKFSDKLGQNFIVENVAGGATLIAMRRVVSAKPDGYTILLHNLQISANVSLHPKQGFDTEKDLVPIAFINHNPLVLVGRKSIPANTLSELVTWMKSQPAKFAIPGVGTSGHLATSLFAQQAKVSIDQIPYKGAAPALQDILGEHVDLFFATPQSVVQSVRAGQMKAFGITSKEKSPLFPDAASMVQAFGPKLEIRYWHALFAPGGTPKPVIDKLNAVLQEVVEDPAILKAWAESGVAPYPKEQRSPQAAQAMLHSEIERWAQVVRENGIRAEAQ